MRGARLWAALLTVALLAARGFEVVASTGRAQEHAERLRALGAAQVVG